MLDYTNHINVESDGGTKFASLYSMKDLAAALNISRASLYRVLMNLEKEGIIQRSKTVFVSKTLTALFNYYHL